MTDAETAADLIAKGYRRTSNKYRTVSRIDRPDWLNVLAINLHRAPADFYVPGESSPCGGWCDYYRRVISKDKIEVSPEVYALIPGSGHDPVGYLGPAMAELTSEQIEELILIHLRETDRPNLSREIATALGIKVPKIAAILAILKKRGKVIKKVTSTGMFMRKWPGAHEFEIKRNEWTLRKSVTPTPLTDDMRTMLEDLQGIS